MLNSYYNGDVFLHRRGRAYIYECRAKIERDLTDAVVYRSHDTGDVWVRPAGEFFDGRFAPVGADRDLGRRGTICVGGPLHTMKKASPGRRFYVHVPTAFSWSILINGVFKRLDPNEKVGTTLVAYRLNYCFAGDGIWMFDGLIGGSISDLETAVAEAIAGAPCTVESS